MAIKIIEGNIFESEMQTLVNPVNCVGVMGAGLAKEFRKRFPENFGIYLKVCANRGLQIGQSIYYYENGYKLINIPTKDHYRDKSSISIIEQAMLEICRVIDCEFIHSIAIPALGCGLGGLNFSDVKDVMLTYLSQMYLSEVEIYTPKGYYANNTSINEYERY